MTTKKVKTASVKKVKTASVQEKPNNSISNCSIVMNMQADGATQLLSEALIMQAEANKATSNAIEQLARTLKPIDVCGIKITNDGVGFN